MDLAGELNNLTSSITSQRSNIAADIQRLETALSDIKREQETGFQEKKTLTEPELGASWKGTRADSFDEDREAASEKMDQILHYDFSMYISSIESKISTLQNQIAALTALDIVSNEAEDLIRKGEDAIDSAISKLGEIRKGLASWL
ncbi:YwqH-like family protein [Jeotgalibacillus campisalis]|uniref:Uncharacterized protein n=1 Tax=Jeotgalibacillus campisalis TaxID=220754 RepID=A0A0C2W572_9BACL|nr:DUF5082 family protein [Jeotgalibacillus campisalis]KIL51168.1 hypothetical protein KR50_10490 [Jeotgalibacillus campisalis]